MTKSRIEAIEKKMKPGEMSKRAPGNLFVLVEGGRLYLDGEQITDEQAREYLNRTKTGNEEPFEFVKVKDKAGC